MNNTPYTKLNDRVLFFDGDSIAKNENIVDMILNGVDVQASKVHLLDESDETKKFLNRFPDGLSYKTNIKPPTPKWMLPSKYKDMDIKQYVYDKLIGEVDSFDDENEVLKRVDRVEEELSKWEKNDMLNLLKTLVYIIDTFKEKNIVWGTGRGSSCCCYILYLIGVHDVDSVLYELELNEFFR